MRDLAGGGPDARGSHCRRPQLPYILDLAGTFVFALSVAMAGVKHRLDVFGALVLSFAAATTGGITRDVLIGAIPPRRRSNRN
jgi:uncharacterized membrane protein YeiH